MFVDFFFNKRNLEGEKILVEKQSDRFDVCPLYFLIKEA